MGWTRQSSVYKTMKALGCIISKCKSNYMRSLGMSSILELDVKNERCILTWRHSSIRFGLRHATGTYLLLGGPLLRILLSQLSFLEEYELGPQPSPPRLDQASHLQYSTLRVLGEVHVSLL